MDMQGTLETIAQVGVTLAGFAGIVGALAGDKLRPAHPEVWLPFWAMIASGVGLVFGALAPQILDAFGFREHVVWSASSAFVFLLTGGNLLFFLPRILRAARDGRFRRIPAIAHPLDFTCFVVMATQLANALGIGFSQSAAGLLLGLYLLLFVCSMNFAYLLYVIGRAPDDRTGS